MPHIPLIPLPIQIPQIRHPKPLPVAKAGIASITTIIHEIVNRIIAYTARASVLHISLQTGASIRTDALLRRIIDVIARVGRIAALILKRVEEAEPVPDFMHGGLALLVVLQAAVGHRGREHVAAVVDVVAGSQRLFLA